MHDIAAAHVQELSSELYLINYACSLARMSGIAFFRFQNYLITCLSSVKGVKCYNPLKDFAMLMGLTVLRP